MPFNHYVKVQLILSQHPEGWYITHINEPTSAKNFKGETVSFTHFYRIYDHNDQPIKYCKFQQIDPLAKALRRPVEDLPIVE